MRHGARIRGVKYLQNRSLRAGKCKYKKCKTALRKENKCGLCHKHYNFLMSSIQSFTKSMSEAKALRKKEKQNYEKEKTQ